MPFDSETLTPIYIKKSMYKIVGDVDAAVSKGVELTGQAYSGSWEAVTELLYFAVQHQVAPASDSLGCMDCHSPNGRLDFAALGYSEAQAAELATRKQ